MVPGTSGTDPNTDVALRIDVAGRAFAPDRTDVCATVSSQAAFGDRLAARLNGPSAMFWIPWTANEAPLGRGPDDAAFVEVAPSAVIAIGAGGQSPTAAATRSRRSPRSPVRSPRRRRSTA